MGCGRSPCPSPPGRLSVLRHTEKEGQIEKEPLFLNRTQSRENLKKSDISFICVPIKMGSMISGALSVDRLFSEDIAFEEDVRLLSIVASMIAQGLKIQQMVRDEKTQLLNENITLKEKLRERYSLYNILGTSNKMTEVFQMIGRIAQTDVTVLVRGESGTGKELVANAIHFNSARASKPFLKLNCAALPDTLVESELFGHEKGAFTERSSRGVGRFERADGGTLFLDEIGTLNLTAQAKLLRILQEREFERIGGNRTLRVDVRIIAATSKDLERSIEEGTFREDLYYRLNVFPIFMPPASREEDGHPPIWLTISLKNSTKNIKRKSRGYQLRRLTCSCNTIGRAM